MLVSSRGRRYKKECIRVGLLVSEVRVKPPGDVAAEAMLVMT
jgi:hypothetical protein